MTPVTDLHGPKVTIAIPTLNRLRYLRLALEGALAQTYRNIEVIVSDNASTDGTSEYLAGIDDPRLRVLQQPLLLPMTQNWNTCVAAATGEYFLLLSDDDILAPSAIEELVDGFGYTADGGTAPGIVYCGGQIIDADGAVKRTFAHSPVRESARDLALAFFSGRRDLWLCAILFRTVDVRPGFSVDFAWAPDSAIWLTAVFQQGSAVYVPRELVQYRVHENATASLPLEVWLRELRHLGCIAIVCDAERPNADPAFPTQMDQTIESHIVRSLPQRINSSLRHRKLKALRQYGTSLPIMANPHGIRFLLMGLAFLFLPKNAETWLRGVVKGKPA